MKVKLIVLAFFCLLSFVTAEAKKPENLKYDIECVGNGAQSTYLVKVWVYGKASQITSDVLKKYAVHGVIFKGYSGRNGCTSQKPMAQSPVLEQERADFFDAFFNNDRSYAKYTTEVDGTTERVKVGKEYKIAAVISVSKELLRQDLEKAGIIRGLSSGF
ncbi:MAG: hypothetical protein LBT04_07515 [Prevotellaceae bacterium]|jgi:hypothetical protein|nr:hypothetical protein [Prevotellaceae bacterium]